MRRILEDEPPIDTLPDSVPWELRALLRVALAKDPEARPTADEFVSGLASVIDERDTFWAAIAGDDPAEAGRRTDAHTPAAVQLRAEAGSVELDRRVLIGRSPEPAELGVSSAVCLVIKGDKRVSRNHALVSVSGAQMLVFDLYSGNGTFVERRGARVSVDPDAPGARLEVGDRIWVGNSHIDVVMA